MNQKDRDKLEIILIFSITFTVGVAIGITLDDNHWKNELNNFADKDIRFTFDTKTIYIIQKVNTSSFSLNYTAIPYWKNYNSTIIE